MVSRVLLCLSFCVLSVACGSPAGEVDKAKDEAKTSEGKVTGASAKVRALRGRGGLSSPDLEEGHILGEGAKLGPGQRISTPRGLRAELELGGADGQSAGVLRLDEGTDLSLPSDQSSAELHAGRVIAVAASTPLKLRRGKQELELTRGRVQVESKAGDEATHWSLLEGEALVRDEQGEHPLEIGAELLTPVPVKAPPPAATLAPLEESRWSDTFDPGPTLAAATTLPPGVGSLTARRPNSTARSQPLRITEQTVRVTVRDRVAYTEIEQAFFNDANEELEGTYRFPLPADASIAGLQLLVGNRWMEGAMVEKLRARQIFKSIVDRVVPRDPALLEWEQGSIFKLKIFPIPAKGQRRVRLSYTQKLDEVGMGRLRYRYPMGGSGTGDTQIENFDFQITVDQNNLAAAGTDAVRTPMMELERRNEAGHLVLSHRATGFVPTHELGVDLPAPEPEFVTHQDRDGQNYFMLTMRPEFKAPEGGPVDYVFVVDRSHGTAPELWGAARGVVDTTIAALGSDDRVAVLACDTACDAWQNELGATGPETRKSVDAFLGRQELGGASDIGAMMVRAASYFPAQSGGQRVIMYLGDGVPSSGELSANGLVDLTRSEAMRGVRMQAVAMGSRADTLLLEAMTRSTGGDLLKAGTSDDFAALARELQFRARVPVIDDLELELPAGAFDVHPAVVPPLRNGEAMVVVGKLPPASSWRPEPTRSEVALRRRSTNERYAVPVTIAPAGQYSEHPYLPRLWAAEEIAKLTTHEGHAAKSRIVALSEAYTVLSRYTALLALENDAMYRRYGVNRRASEKDQWKGELSKSADGMIAMREGTGTSSRSSALELGSSSGAGRGFGGSGKQRNEDPNLPAGNTAAPAPQAAPSAEPIEEELEEPAADESREEAKAAESERFMDAEVDATEVAQPASDADLGGEDFDFDADKDAKPSKGDGPFETVPSASAPSRKKKKSVSKKPSSRPRPNGGGSFGGDLDDVPQIAKPYPLPTRRPPRPRLRIRAAGLANDGALSTLSGLLAKRDANPKDRNAHRRLVSAAVRAGDPRAGQWASQWAAADPDYGRALMAQGDALASQGHPMTIRAYESAAEARPFDRKLHEWLARGLETQGEWERACSHRRAVVSIDPARADAWLKLSECEFGAGHRANADSVLRAGIPRVKRSDQSRLDRALAKLARGEAYQVPALPGRPDVRASLTWTGDAEFDIAFIDSRGRRLSTLRPEAGVKGRREAGSHTLTLRRYQKPVYVEVSRRDEGTSPISLELTVKTPDGRRKFALNFAGSQRHQRIARVYRR